jgi:hypothetical protein
MEVEAPVKVILTGWIRSDPENDEECVERKRGQSIFLLFLDQGCSLPSGFRCGHSLKLTDFSASWVS